LDTADYQFVFVIGMPRSGTTALARLVASHPKISGLTNTGVPWDEGDYLQSVYPKEAALGGCNRFGLHPQAHLTENSSLLEDATEQLFGAWSPYWDLSKPILCEKTPANIVRTRFLQAALPNSKFIIVERHPIAHALAVLRFNYRARLTTIIRNWLACHRYLAEDLPRLRHSLRLHYEDLARDPLTSCRAIENFLQVERGLDPSRIKSGLNEPYLRSWRARDFRDGPYRLRNFAKRIWSEAEVRHIERRYEGEINAFGYSFFEASPTRPITEVFAFMPSLPADGSRSRRAIS
jgi:hypothetical protein